MSLHICVHGHFYQPPRENPWLEEVENQKSAYPYNNWNERINEECYAPNAAARILDSSGFITSIENNYSRMSFNFGPTLLSWMESHAPETYESILKADSEGQKRFSGHGPAIAQAYNHMILPLANDRDKRTQILWGIADFERRFRRFPEGMWLPETAVDLRTLDILAEEGIRFTVLSPFQASRIRKTGKVPWKDAGGGKIDPSIPYLCRLPSGRSISLFFYEGRISQEIAFGGLLNNGETFAKRLIGAGKTVQGEDRLISVATDGETYGHHHKYGDMALAYCLESIERSKEAGLTIYAEYLEKHPATAEVEIVENSSWSCVHGVGRWKEDCGCSTGSHPDWNQAWRAPLRNGLDHIRDRLEPVFLKSLQGLVADPWKARNDYISVILDRNTDVQKAFLNSHCHRDLSPEEKIQVFKAFEMQRMAMLMFTSCGWFFDDISGIETLQILRYAAHAIQYARQISGVDLEPDLLEYLGKAGSNMIEYGRGSDIYRGSVLPYQFGLEEVGVHYGILSLFSEKERDVPTYCYSVVPSDIFSLNAGKIRFCAGSVKISSGVTLESCNSWFAALYFGGHNVICRMSSGLSEDLFRQFISRVEGAFAEGRIPEVINLIRNSFDGHDHDLGSLFRNEQEDVLKTIITEDLARLRSFLQEIIEDDHLVLNFMASVRMPVPPQFLRAAEVVLNAHILEEFGKDEPDPSIVQSSFSTAGRWKVVLDKENIKLAASRWIDSRMQFISENIQDISAIRSLSKMIRTIRETGIDPDLWSSQNTYFRIISFSDRGKISMNELKKLGHDLGIKV
jgi:alpha-amylase/alpha-mannosidase (GH57 family)